MLNYVERSPLVTDTPLFHENFKKIQEIYSDLLLDNPGLDQRPYQPQLAAMYASRPNNICVGGQGLGKTLITGLIISLLLSTFQKKSPNPGTVQIAVPSLLFGRSRWLPDLLLLRDLQDCVEVINSDKQLLASKKPCWVYTHDFLKRKTKQLSTARPYVSRLIVKNKLFPKLLIVDEAHHLQAKSLRMQHMQILRKRAERVLLLSGTLADDLEHLHCLLKFCYRRDWKTSRSAFLQEFQTIKQSKTNYLAGEEDLVDLPKRYLPQLSVFKVPDYYTQMKTKVHRVTLNDSFVRSVIKLPEPRKRVELVELDLVHNQDYKNLVHRHLNDIRSCRDYRAEAKALQIIHPLIKCVNFPDGHVSTKIQRCVELVGEFKARGLKTVVFHNNVGSGRLVYSELQKKFGEESVVRLYAEDAEATPKHMNTDKREEALTKFLFSEKVCAGVFSIRLAGESLDLLQASAIIFYDVPWEIIKVAQATSRCVRPGAVNDFVEIVHLVAPKTIDEHMHELAAEKLKHMQLLLDYSPDQGYDPGRIKALDILDKILEAI
ncbi:DNA/RNA helicase, superfamily II, SNF2 family [Leptolyngbyaceae cyanobacterium JSC-12]|nr:DNA/RNA helicase, superfamily II, SNF2 family [Leptolyngbyaceae cyanobacterium JSC-12]